MDSCVSCMLRNIHSIYFSCNINIAFHIQINKTDLFNKFTHFYLLLILKSRLLNIRAQLTQLRLSFLHYALTVSDML